MMNVIRVILFGIRENFYIWTRQTNIYQILSFLSLSLCFQCASNNMLSENTCSIYVTFGPNRRNRIIIIIIIVDFFFICFKRAFFFLLISQHLLRPNTCFVQRRSRSVLNYRIILRNTLLLIIPVSNIFQQFSPAITKSLHISRSRFFRTRRVVQIRMYTSISIIGHHRNSTIRIYLVRFQKPFE